MRVLASSLVVAAVGLPGGMPAQGQSSGVRLVGDLPLPPDWPDVGSAGGPVSVDPVGRKLYAVYRRSDLDRMFAIVYDISSDGVPTIEDVITVEGTAGGLNVSNVYTTRDTIRNRILLLVPWRNYPSTKRIVMLDLRTRRTTRWDPLVPGYQMMGLRYSEEDDLVYVIAEPVVMLEGEGAVHRPQTVTTVFAVHPENGSLVWAKPIDECQMPMNRWNNGAEIFRSSMRRALYLPCARTTAAPRVAGLAVIHLGEDPRHATSADALGYPVSFFPVSGGWQQIDYGLNAAVASYAAHDSGSDRVVMNSVSTSYPGAWVFDATRLGWVGFVGAPGGYSAGLPVTGVNSGAGHLYMSTVAGARDNPRLLVTDVRGTPVPQGAVHPFRLGRWILTDPATRTLFAWMEDDTGSARWVVMEDLTRSEPPPALVDYDSRTQNIPEGEGVESIFAGAVSGFGLRARWVGGTAGLRTEQNGLSVRPSEYVRATTGVGSGDRDMLMARVRGLDLRGAAASAAAQAVEPDPATYDEWQTRPTAVRRACQERIETLRGLHNDVEGYVPSCPGPIDQALDGLANGHPGWPWEPTTCLDGVGTPEEPPAKKDPWGLGEASVSCDLAAQRSEASSSAEGFRLDRVSVASASFTASVHRDPEVGTLSEATALAEGVRIGVPGGPSVWIAAVTAQARAVAHGRPGTAKVTWDRTLSGIVVQPAGGPPQRLPDCSGDTCEKQLATINDAIEQFARVDMLPGELRTTPGGAFAAITKRDRDYYQDLTVQNDTTRSAPAVQIVAFADGHEKSRVLVQLAAIEATALYTVWAAEAPPPAAPSRTGGPFPPDPTPPGTEGPGPQVEGPGPADGGGSFDAGDIARLPKEVLAFVVRSPLEALQLGTVLMLFGAAGAGVMRRRSMKDVLARSS